MRRNPDFDRLERGGYFNPGAVDWAKLDYDGSLLAEDAQPTLSTTPNSGIPAFLTTIVDPSIITILFSPNKAAEIFGEVKKGDWLMDTALFPIVEYTGEVSSYGDDNENGSLGLNTDFPNRQSYHYQIIKQYGDRAVERADLARIAWVSELEKACIAILNKFQNLTYFFGVSGLLNYGLLNDPRLPASLSPTPKAAGGVTWFTATGAPNATANEVYNDIVAIYQNAVINAGGNIEIEMTNPMVLAMATVVQQALTFTNSFGITVRGMLEQSYPKMKFDSAVQYGALSATNPQGIAGGNEVQLIVSNIGGQETGYCAFTEKLRNHRIIPSMSSFKQKATQGTWGAIIKQAFAISSMIGV
jgi:hypothetical protein